MKIIKAGVELLAPAYGDAVLRRLEACGRVCYKSEDNIKEGSAETFLKGIIKRGHEAVLEHASIIAEVDYASYLGIRSLVEELEEEGEFASFLRFTSGPLKRSIVSGNIRAWRDFAAAIHASGRALPNCFELISQGYPVLFPEAEGWSYLPSPAGEFTRLLCPCDLAPGAEQLVHLDFTVKFTCDRGVSHEIVRHRVASYCQESTRYCNYSKGKFGGEITLIEPCYLEKDSEKWNEWLMGCAAAERRYFNLLFLGATPQEARAVLPNSLKTEVMMTANLREWRHFLRLRCAKTAHPQMREVALLVLEELHKTMPVLFDDLYAEFSGA